MLHRRSEKWLETKRIAWDCVDLGMQAHRECRFRGQRRRKLPRKPFYRLRNQLCDNRWDIMFKR